MNNKENSFVILTPGFPSSEADSTCLPMHQHFIRCLKSLYPELNVIVLSFQYPYRTGNYKWFDTTVIGFNGQNKGGIAKLLIRKKVYAALKKIMNESAITGLLSFWYGECALVGKKFGRRNKIAHCCWLLGQDAKKANKYPARTSLKENELVALSDFLQDEFERNHGTRPGFVIPHGNNMMQAFVLQAEKDIDILAAGSLIPLKQYDIFIEVVAEIKRSLPLVRCLLAGDGPEKEKLQQLIENAGLRDMITLTGELPHDAVLQLMQRTKIFLHPSSYEGLSGVCLEALSMGCHVISFTKPMHESIKQWNITASKDEMSSKAAEILQNNDTVYERQVVFKMEDTVRKMMDLFK